MSVFRLKCLICTSVLKVILRMRDDVNIIVFCVLHAKSRMQFKQIILTAAKICITKQTVAMIVRMFKLQRFAMFLARRML